MSRNSGGQQQQQQRGPDGRFVANAPNGAAPNTQVQPQRQAGAVSHGTLEARVAYAKKLEEAGKGLSREDAIVYLNNPAEYHRRIMAGTARPLPRV